MSQKTKQNIDIFDEYAKLVLESNKYGKVEFIISKDDIDKVLQYSWSVAKRHHGLYACCNGKINFPKQRLLHRYLMDCPNGKCVDHINRNTLDNRKENLRICSYTENNQNMSRMKSKLNIRHIHLCDRKNKKYHLEFKKEFRKRFSTLKSAIIARNEYIKEKHPEYYFWHQNEFESDLNYVSELDEQEEEEGKESNER